MTEGTRNDYKTVIFLAEVRRVERVVFFWPQIEPAEELLGMRSREAGEPAGQDSIPICPLWLHSPYLAPPAALHVLNAFFVPCGEPDCRKRFALRALPVRVEAGSSITPLGSVSL